jgi:hypothetical protein
MGEELWYVKLANGDVHRVTIDQLDGAFQAGHIDESTMVLAAGGSEWTKLGDLAGLDEGDAPPPPPEPAAEEIAYVPQAGAALSAAAESVAAAAPAALPAAVEVITYVPQTRPPPYVASAYAAPVPVATRAVAAPAAYAPPAPGTPYSVAVPLRPAAVAAPPVANSLRPMSMDLGDLDLDAPFKRKPRAGRFVAAVIAVAAIAGGATIASNRLHLHLGIGGGASDLSNVAAAAAMAAPPVADPVVAPPPAAPLPPAASPSPATVSATASDGSPMNPQFTSRFNEDTTKKLLSADKTRNAKSKSRHSGGGASGSSHTKSTTFTTGGNKFDPLNSAI